MRKQPRQGPDPRADEVEADYASVPEPPPATMGQQAATVYALMHGIVRNPNQSGEDWMVALAEMGLTPKHARELLPALVATINNLQELLLRMRAHIGE